MNATGFVETPACIIDLMCQIISVRNDEERKKLKILDTGAGKGNFIDGLLKHKFENISAVEISDDFLCLLKEKYVKYPNINIINGSYLNKSNLLNENFDVIIGNPPYVHFRNLSETLKDEVKGICHNSLSNIYHAFIYRSIDLLNDGGQLIYIVPIDFFYTTYAKDLRRYMLESGHFELIMNFGEMRIFEGESPEVIIFKYIKTSKNACFKRKIKIYDFWEYGKNKKLSDIDWANWEKCVKNYEIEHFSKEMFIWNISNANNKKQLTIIKESSKKVKLSDILDIGVGMVSGYDDAFIVDRSFLEFLSEQERKYVLPIIKAKDCVRNKEIKSVSSYGIILNGLDIEYIKERLPNLYSHIIGYFDFLSSRYLPKGKFWWEWQALRNIKKMKNNTDSCQYSQETIFVPVMDRNEDFRFCYSRSCFYAGSDVLFLRKKAGVDIDINEILFFLTGERFKEQYFDFFGHNKGGRKFLNTKILGEVCYF